jgi:WD40 repeat protein
MARVVEPVFCSTTFPYLPGSDDVPIAQDGFGSGRASHQDDEQDMDCHDTNAPESVDEAVIEEAMFQGPLESELLLQRPQAQYDNVFQEEDSWLGRVALATPDLVLPFEMRSDPLNQSRTVSHQPSCDSLRNVSTTTDLRQTALSIDGSHIVTDTEHDSLPEEVRLQPNSAAQYTILTDMAETAWSVDDPRYGADVLDSLSSWTSWNSSAAQVKLADALVERAVADQDTLPAFNRQESIKSGVDMQGINWESYGVARQQCLRDRANLHRSSSSNHMLVDDEPTLNAQSERFYRFHYFNGSKRPKFAHHQLRHVLASVGRDVYYSNASKVMQASLACPSAEETVLDLTRSAMTSTPIRVTCLAATDSAIIVAGGFDGEYALRSLNSSAPHSEGYVTHDHNGLVTHIHTFAHRRSGLPQAAFCANDQRLRLMDLTTETFTKTLAYDYSLNSAVTSSDGRLRALVGDSPDALISDAESGESLTTLRSHSAHIFSCAWSPDDRLLATGAQDGKIAIWDSRNWAQPLVELPNALSCSRSLHFTSDSSKLISAENEDIVSIFDTRNSFERQDIHFFGTISGVALVDGGDEIVIANGDRSVGGLMSFRRVRYGGGGDFKGWSGGELDSVEGYGRRRNVRRRWIVEELVV